MAELNICATIIAFTLFISTQIHATEVADEEDEPVLEYMCLLNHKFARIHFYAQQDKVNATAYEVARVSVAVSSDTPLSFGKVFIVGDVIIGQGSGNVYFRGANMRTTAAEMNLDAVFASQNYNASNLSVDGRNPLDRWRWLPAAGGKRGFRYLRGHAVVSSYSSRLSEDSVLYTVLEYTIYAMFCQ